MTSHSISDSALTFVPIFILTAASPKPYLHHLPSRATTTSNYLNFHPCILPSNLTFHRLYAPLYYSPPPLYYSPPHPYTTRPPTPILLAPPTPILLATPSLYYSPPHPYTTRPPTPILLATPSLYYSPPHPYTTRPPHPYTTRPPPTHPREPWWTPPSCITHSLSARLTFTAIDPTASEP